MLREVHAARPQRFHDLDGLKAAWSKAEADEFEGAVAPFGEVDPTLWVAEPAKAYRAKPARRRRPTPR